MIKLIYCMRRLPHLSLEEFQSHWREYHSQFSFRLQSLRRYVQCHTLSHDPTRQIMARAGGSTIEPFDGAAVAWWDSAEAMHAETETNPDFLPAVDDMKFFIDTDRSIGCLTEEHVIVEPEGSVPYIMVACLRRRSGIDRAAFHKAWLNHAEIGRRMNAEGLLKGYIQNHTLVEGETGGLEALRIVQEPWDGIGMGYFDSVAKFKAMVGSPLSRESLEKEKEFIDHSRSAYMLTRRIVTKDVVR